MFVKSSLHNELAIETFHAGDGVDANPGHGESTGSKIEFVAESGRSSWLFIVGGENDSTETGHGLPKERILSTWLCIICC